MSQSRSFCFTWNNPPEEPTFPPSRYLCYGKEIAPSTGTPHLQGVIVFPSPRRLPAVIKQLKGCHVEICHSVQASIKYCKKDGDFIELGDPPATPLTKGETEMARWTAARRAAERGDFSAVPDDIYIRYRSSLRAIHVETQALPPDSETLTGLWLWGPPGSGKSRKAREDYPGIFDKACNKWWDGYVSGPALLDDFDLTHKKLGHHLKRWADRYAFSAEIKGGTVCIRPTRIVVTSNYSISQIFGDDAVLTEALTRRFEILHLDFNPITNPEPRYFGLNRTAY